jgi:vacuolar-type H+-ATPase subunit I/STV1
MFAVMKRFASLLLCSAFLKCSLLAADAGLEPADVEEIKRLIGRVQDLEEGALVYRRKIEDLTVQLEGMRSALREANENSSRKMAETVNRDDLKRLTEKLQEVDQKREADKRLILEEIEKLPAKLVKTIPSAPPPWNGSNSKSNRTERTEKTEDKKPTGDSKNEMFFTHKVERNENLSDIINAYNAELKKEGKGQVTLESVRKANPKININKIYVGQEILIPVPPDKK